MQQLRKVDEKRCIQEREQKKKNYLNEFIEGFLQCNTQSCCAIHLISHVQTRDAHLQSAVLTCNILHFIRCLNQTRKHFSERDVLKTNETNQQY